MAAVADNKRINLNTLDIGIAYEILANKQWVTTLKIKIDPGKGLSRRERTILFNAARFCEVSKILKGEKVFEYELAPDAS